MRRVLATFAAATATALAGAACASDTTAGPATSTSRPAPTTTTTRPASYEVHRETVTFVDRSRPTADPNHLRDAPTRTLPTDVYVPDGDGPFPLIVHAHGAAGNPGKFTQLLGAWAEKGYVVVAPQFPLTNDRTGPVVIDDYVNQPADEKFVLDSVLQRAREDGNVLSGKVDADRIGASGLSLGGATTYGFAFNDCCADARIDAAMILSGIKLPFDDAPYDFSRIPIFLSHGTADPIPADSSREAYAQATAPKFFVTLIDGTHAPPYEDTPSPHDDLVIDVTTDFWDAYLYGDGDAAARLVEDATVPKLGSVEHEG